MTATINGSYTKRQVLKVWRTTHGTYYRLELDGNLSRTITNLWVTYRSEHLKIYDVLQCRQQQHAAYQRKPLVRQRRVAA